MRLPKGAALTRGDLAEIERFKQWLALEESRRACGDPAMLNMLEQALYPEGIGRDPIDGPSEAS